MNSNNGIVLAIVAAILLAIGAIINPVYIIGAGEVGVTFNRLTGVTASHSQGTHLAIPLVQSVDKFDVRTQRLDITAASASKDLQKVDIELALNTHLDYTKVNDLYTRVGKDYIQKIIEPAVNECVKAAAAKFPVEEIIVKREELKTAVEQSLKIKLAEYNIILENCNLINIKFDPEFEKVVEAKQIEEQKIKTAQYCRMQAEEKKKQTILEGEGEARRQELLKQSVSEKGIAMSWIDKWDGKLPEMMLGNGANLLITPKVRGDEK